MRCCLALISSLKDRVRADEILCKIFKDTTTLAKRQGEDYELRPMLNAQQSHSANITVHSTDEYLLYNEFLSHVVTELEQRFSCFQCQTLSLLQLLLFSSREVTDIPD